ncbi:carbohydrate ABC transporter permease [Pseudonocardia nigra]|uniref:carbohydrate ABC transporter permease n=1 Tax=Pseudonocardia nigra TaxID=1921578 RepID=UPI001FE8E70B|nr:carbohydrate ABC transporter permease [Pseudonocardia nigra]
MTTSAMDTETPAQVAPSPKRRRRRSEIPPIDRTSPIVRAVQYVLLAAYVVFLAFPLLWMLSTSFKPAPELVELHPTLIPQAPTLGNYADAFTEQALVRSALNSLIVASASAALTVLVAVPAAYALVRLRSWLAKPVLGWVLVSQLFPFILIVIPLFLILSEVGLVDNRAGLILVYVVWTLPFALWMLQGYVRNLPRDIEEAATVDGASRVQVLRAIVFPLLLPGIIATTLFAFITAWNEFFFALVLIKSPELTTLPLALARFVGIEGVARLGPLAAGALLATLPSLAFFSFIQRGLAGGLLAGATKG